MFRKDFAGNQLIVGRLELVDGATAFVELDRSGGGTLIHRMVLLGYGAVAGLMLAGDDGRVGR